MKIIATLILFISLFQLPILSQNKWVQIHPYPTLNNLRDVHFNSEQEGWIIGNGFNSMIMYTNDGGVSWETQLYGNGPLSQKPYSSLFFIDDNEGWAGGWKNIHHTTDKGESWNPQQVPDKLYIVEDIFFIDENNGWAVGENSIILKTTNGGQLWNTKLYQVSEVWLNSVYFTSNMKGIAVGRRNLSDGIILKTEDGGETWIDISPNNCYEFTKVTFTDTLTGWICGYGGTGGQPAELYSTTDGGYTWEYTSNLSSGAAKVYFINENTGWYYAGPYIYHTYDGGLTWTTHEYFSYTFINDIFMIDDNQGWLAGNTGFVAICDFTVDMREDKNLKSQHLVFPNPSSTHIKLSDPNYTLQLHNLQGQNIMLLPQVDQQISLNGLAPGVYIATIRKEGIVIGREKLIVR